jgi:Pyruvate/2-oxoacid:ferredoxin oxidoreductase delta subunit
LESPVIAHLGCISLKTAVPGTQRKHNPERRIMFTDLIPDTLICRGQVESLTIEEVSVLSKWLRRELNNKKLPIKIKLSLHCAQPGDYVETIQDLKSHKAEFDIVEIPLKYVHKMETDRPLNLRILHELTEREFYRSFQNLIWLRVALEFNGLPNVPVSLKMAPENFRPGLLASWLMAPRNPYFKELFEDMKKRVVDDVNCFEVAGKYGINPKTVREMMRKENGSEYVVLFDSEKFPSFFPSKINPRRSSLIATEAGYPSGGGAMAGKAIEKDSLKYTFETAETMRRIGKDNFGIISSGGCDNGYDLATRLIFGASLVEICSPLTRYSPVVIENITHQLDAYLKVWGISDWHSIIGLAHNHLTKKEEEDYLPIDFGDDNVDACLNCGECSVWCWVSNKWAKGQAWPAELCKECSSCLYLCKGDRFKISRFWES